MAEAVAKRGVFGRVVALPPLRVVVGAKLVAAGRPVADDGRLRSRVNWGEARVRFAGIRADA